MTQIELVKQTKDEILTLSYGTHRPGIEFVIDLCQRRNGRIQYHIQSSSRQFKTGRAHS